MTRPLALALFLAVLVSACYDSPRRIRGHGEPCHRSSEFDPPTTWNYIDNCAEGLVCAGLAGADHPICVQACAPEVGVFCDGPDEQCVGEATLRSAGGACVPNGTTPHGGVCDYPEDGFIDSCMSGASCLFDPYWDDEEGSRCHVLCRDPDVICPSGEACNDDWGLCQPLCSAIDGPFCGSDVACVDHRCVQWANAAQCPDDTGCALFLVCVRACPPAEPMCDTFECVSAEEAERRADGR